MFEVNKNTYVTANEADELIKQHFSRYDGLRLFWEVLDEDEKESYLIRAAEQIDSLAYPSRKTYPTQGMAFPRVPEQVVSSKVKLAQVYNALGVLNAEIKQSAKEHQDIYERMGVVFKPQIAPETGFAPLPDKLPLASSKACETLKLYRMGGFRMR